VESVAGILARARARVQPSASQVTAHADHWAAFKPTRRTRSPCSARIPPLVSDPTALVTQWQWSGAKPPSAPSPRSPPLPPPCAGHWSAAHVRGRSCFAARSFVWETRLERHRLAALARTAVRRHTAPGVSQPAPRR
jgi:hypothetical protein